MKNKLIDVMEIEIMEFFKIIFTVTVAAVGWLVTHYYTSKRNIENSRRESRIEALSHSYNALVRTALDGSLVTRKKDGTIVIKAISLENALRPYIYMVMMNSPDWLQNVQNNSRKQVKENIMI